MSNARNLARLLPNASGQLPDAAMSSGSVIQVVSASKLDTFSTSSTNFTAVTGFSASITPISANSKILVIYSCTHGNNNTTPWFSSMTALYRDGNKIAYGNLRNNEIQGSTILPTTNADTGGTVTFQCTDSPNTTNSVTYQVYLRTDSPSYPANIGGSARASSADFISSPSNITLMEIAA